MEYHLHRVWQSILWLLPNWPSVVSHDVAIQSWTDSSTPVGSPTTDPETGEAVAMTYPCEVLGHDRPVFDVIDPLNPRAGLVLTHSALPPTASDPNGCLPDPRTGYPKERELKIYLACDSTVPKDSVAVDSFLEAQAGTCQYELHLRSAAGCGAYGDPYDLPFSPSPSTGSPSNNFGFTILGVVLSIAFFYGAQWADARGYMEGVPKPIRALLPVASSGKGGLGSMSVSSSVSAGSTGSGDGSPFTAKAAYGSL